MIYYLGTVYKKSEYGLKAETDTRFGLYDEQINRVSFCSKAQIKYLIKQGNWIKGFEEITQGILDEDIALFWPREIEERVKDQNYAVESIMNEKSRGMSDRIVIDKPVILDKLFAGVEFIYKELYVSVKKGLKKNDLYLSIENETVGVLFEDITTFVEALEELSFCLSQNNAELLDWHICLPKAKRLDLSQLDGLTLNEKPIVKVITIDTYKAESVYISDKDKYTTWRFREGRQSRTIKEVDLTECENFPAKLVHVLLDLANDSMTPFGQIKFSISENDILSEVMQQIKVKNKMRNEGINLEFLGSFNKGIDYIATNKVKLGSMSLMGKRNTVLLVNLL